MREVFASSVGVMEARIHERDAIGRRKGTPTVVAVILALLDILVCVVISSASVRALSHGEPLPADWTISRLVLANLTLLIAGGVLVRIIIRDLFTVFGERALKRRTLLKRYSLPWTALNAYALDYPTLTLSFGTRVEKVSVLSVADMNELQDFLRKQYGKPPSDKVNPADYY